MCRSTSTVCETERSKASGSSYERVPLGSTNRRLIWPAQIVARSCLYKKDRSRFKFLRLVFNENQLIEDKS